MPHILRDVNPIVATLLTQHHIFYDRAIIIVSSHSNPAPQDNERLILRWVPMDGYHSPRLHCIQEPMALVFQRLVEALCRDHTQQGRLQSQYIFLPRGFIRPVFDFHDDSAGFQGADGVPLADGDVQGDYRAAGREFDGLGAAALQLVIELLHQPTP